MTLHFMLLLYFSHIFKWVHSKLKKMLQELCLLNLNGFEADRSIHLFGGGFYPTEISLTKPL